MNPLKRLGGLLAAVCMVVTVCAVPAMAISIQPTADFFVYDGANVLTEETEQYIVEKNAGLSQQTGAQIVVVTVENTEGYSCEDYAYEIGNSWGVGSSEENNGVVLLLDIGSEDYQCLQGSGLTRTLPTPTLSRILQEKLEPDFAAADYDAGVRKTFDALYSEVSSIYGYTGTPSGTVITPDRPSTPQTRPQEQSGGVRSIFGLFSTALVFIAVVFLISVLTKAGRSGNAQSRGTGTPFQTGTPYMPNGTPYVGGQPNRQNNSAMPFILGMLLGSSRNRHHHHHDDDDHFGGFGGFGGGGFGGFGGGGGGFGGGGGGGGFGGGGGGFGGGGAGRGH